MNKSIPLVNLFKMHNSLKKEIKNEILNIINSNNFLSHSIIERMEKNFAKKNNSKFCVAVSSGTSALKLALQASGVGKNDEVITTSNSFFSTLESIIHVGAKPVLIDVSKSDLNLNIELIEKKINKKTKAIVPVHIYGKPVNIDQIIAVANKYNLIIVEDCAQSHFAKFKEKYVGNFSSASAFSFYPGKNLGGFGDSGCVITNNLKIYKNISSLKDHGRSSKYSHKIVGYNDRIDAIQATIINLKLKYIEEWNSHRRYLANVYMNELSNLNEVSLFNYFEDEKEHVFHLFVISLRKKYERIKLIKYLKANNIETGIHYPTPIHLQPSVKNYYNINEFPVINEYKDKILSLPICPFTTQNDIKFVAKKIKEFYKIKV